MAVIPERPLLPQSLGISYLQPRLLCSSSSSNRKGEHEGKRTDSQLTRKHAAVFLGEKHGDEERREESRVSTVPTTQPTAGITRYYLNQK